MLPLPNKLFLVFIVSALLLSLAIGQRKPTPAQAASGAVCRFGITSVHGSSGYDIASIGVGSYLDWGANSNPSLPAGVEYIHVLRVRNDLYPQTLANLPGWVSSNPGSVWVVGNEPDTTYGNQDAVTPEVYANRFYELATQIRGLDSTALIGFGTVVQPTPIRMRYLDRAWTRLVSLAGSAAAASALIDIWSIHSFILNEQPYSWGCGVPPGFEHDYADAVIITNFADTYSIAIFQQRITTFRAWLANKGERNKPLWITEYGSLLPPIDPPGGPNYVNVSDEDTANFMVATFNFMLGAASPQTGLPTDGNRLVQRWFWYSLNDHRYNFGGSLFDPDSGNTPTLVGQEFRNFQALTLAQPDLFPKDLFIVPISYVPGQNLVNYQLYLTIGNSLSADTGSNAQAMIYDGNPATGGNLIAGPISFSAIQRCGGSGLNSAPWQAIPLIQYTIYVVVSPIGVVDANPANNQAEFLVFTSVPREIFLPFISH